MPKFALYTVKLETMGLDTQVNLSLEVARSEAPATLSDFYGGVAKLYDGYSISEITYSILLTDYDSRRIKLLSDSGEVLELAPEFTKEDSSGRLLEVPLRKGQKLYEYKIINSSWGLK